MRPVPLSVQADRKEAYTHITPFQEQHDTSVECVCLLSWRPPTVRPLIRRRRFFYKPLTLTALGAGFGVLAYVAMTQDVLREGPEKQRV